MYGRIIHDDQSLLINGEVMSGIQSVGITSELPSKPINILGFGNVSTAFDSLPTNTIDVEKIFLSDDSILKFVTGDQFAHTVLRVKDKYIDFSNSACINSMAIKCSVNSVVNSSFTISAYGETSTGIYSSFLESGNYNHAVRIPTFQSVVVNTDSYNFDRITDLSYTISMTKEPVYAIGARFPVDYYPSYPIEENLTLTVEIDELRFKEIGEKLCQGKYRENILVDINSHCDDLNIFSIYFNSGLLTNQNIRGSINNAVILDLTFTRFSNEFANIQTQSIPSYQITGYYPTIAGPATTFTGSGFSYRIPPYSGGQ